MTEKQKFYKPTEIQYADIIPVYQKAFAGDPWYEVTKCADTQSIKRCIGEFSSLPLGSLCETCGNELSQPAYSPEALERNFSAIAESRPTAWYIEKNTLGINLAALAWTATPQTIAEEKYNDVPEMQLWLKNKLGTDPIIWLDEVFSDREKKSKGNLKNYKDMCLGLADILQNNTIAYRTIAEPMIYAPIRDFGPNSSIYKRTLSVPDRRDFVVISLGGSK